MGPLQAPPKEAEAIRLMRLQSSPEPTGRHPFLKPPFLFLCRQLSHPTRFRPINTPHLVQRLRALLHSLGELPPDS